jgi:hypothetical protein
MTRPSQLRLIFHGSLFMLFTMTLGVPELYIAFNWHMDEPVRQALRQSHAIFMTTGIWMIATAAVLPLLEHTDRSFSIIVWSLVLSGYTFIAALAVLFVGFAFKPPVPGQTQWEQLVALPYHLGYLNGGLVGLSGITSLIPGLFIFWGAYKAARHSPLDAIQ